MPQRCLLYYITDRTAFATDEPGRRTRLQGKMAEAAKAGVDYIQLREKDLTARELESLARNAVGAIARLNPEDRELRTRLLINSRTDIALAAAADGVHLRSDDISPTDVRNIWGQAGTHTLARELVVGVSCHSPEEVVRAEQNGASFAVFAPVFEKNSDKNPAGLSHLREACRTKIPVLALGGVTVENARSCLEAGATGIAGIRLFQENDIAEVVCRLRS